MAYTINDDCINCGVCAPECPTECIKEGGSKFTIVASDCIDCGVCVDACPVDAIKPE